jgi:Protein of unknown function (DUF3106)
LSVLPIHAALSRTLFLTAFAFAQALAHAQTPPAAAPKAAASAAKPVAIAAAVSKPTWAELSPPQQQSLKPLAATWNAISEAQKRKWLEVSKNYPNLPAADQAVMHSRMNEWVAMSPQQRAAARLNFAKTKELSKELTPDEKKAKWQTYQALSPEEKAKLAAKATPKPTGAATAVKPVEPQKLAVTPKGAPALPAVPAAAPIMTRTGDTLQNVVTPVPAK